MEIIIANNYMYHIQQVITDPTKTYTGVLTVEKAESIFIEVFKAKPPLIILDTTINDISYKNATLDFCQKLRIQLPNTRIIIIHQEEQAQKDSVLSPIINLGIYDLVVVNEENEFMFSQMLDDVLRQPKTLSDVFRYHDYSSRPTDEMKIKKEKEIQIKEVEKIVIKEKEVIKHKHIYINNNNIAFINFSNHCGSTFLSTNISKILSDMLESVYYVETPTRHSMRMYNMFDLNLQSKFLNHQNLDFNLSPLKYQNLNLIINSPQKTTPVSDYWVKLMNMNSSVVFDLGTHYLEDEDTYHNLSNFKKVFVVIDPLPLTFSQFASNVVPKLLPMKHNIHFIINHYNSAVDLGELKGELKRHFGSCPITTVKEVPIELLYTAENDNKLLVDLKLKGAEEFKSDCYKVISDFIPKELIPREKGLFKKFKKKNRVTDLVAKEN